MISRLKNTKPENMYVRYLLHDITYTEHVSNIISNN